MRSLLYVSAVLVVVLACSKDKLETTPSLKLKFISATVVPVGGTLNIQFDFTDKEGDISDTVFVKKIRVNRIVVPTLRDSFELQVPAYPDRSRGVIELQLKYQNHLVSAVNPPSNGGTPPDLQDDTLIFKFNLRDKAKNVSDTVTTGQIVIVR